MKLDVGSGDVPAPGEGWTTLDAYYIGADIQAELWAIPLPAESVDELRASHCLEHVSRWWISKTLDEWWRVLKRGGKMTVEVPNMDYACQLWIDGHYEVTPDGHMGAQVAIYGGQGNVGNSHYTGFNEPILRQAIKAAGFHDPEIEVIWSHDMESLEARCVKP